MNGEKKSAKRYWIWAGVIGGFAGLGYWWFARDLPSIISIADYRPLVVSQIIAREGYQEWVLGEYYKEKRYLIPYEQIPDVVIQAFISAEDDRFFEHQGISPIAILRASFANFKAGHVVQGGSTITQQVAKTLFLSSERSLLRKAKEAILAAKLEMNLSKEQILYLYLSQIYLGHGAYGIQAAAITYFHKDVRELTVPEAAVLAGLVKAPGKFSPLSNPKRAKERQLYVLRRMFENGYLSEEELTEAAAVPLRVYYYQQSKPDSGAHYVEHVRRYLADKYGDKALYEDGLTTYVPSNPNLFDSARDALRNGLRDIDKRRGFRGALGRFATTEEAEIYLKKIRDQMIEEAIPFKMLLPDGSIGLYEAIAEAGIRHEDELVKDGELYQALVEKVDDPAGLVYLKIGGVRAVMSMDSMKWAKKFSDDQRRDFSAPKKPSDVLYAGDVVWTKVLSHDAGSAIKNLPSGAPGVLVGLEQQPEVDGSLFSIDVNTGHVLAMVGGYDFAKSEFNRATQAKRQPGSAFKPVIFSAALEKGYTPASIIVDSPIVYEDEEFGKWKPENFEEHFYGDTTFRQAFVHSRNIPTIKIVQALKIPNLIEYAKRIGWAGEFNSDYSISLGSGTTTLLDATKTYATFARYGRLVDPVFFTQIMDRDGRVLEEAKNQEITDLNMIFAKVDPESAVKNLEEGVAPASEQTYPLKEDPAQVLDPRIAYGITKLMKDVVNFGTGRRATALGRPAAAKTGTTSDYKDAWFIGYTPQIATGVWVGFDDQKYSLGPGETGARAALPVWLDFMKVAHENYTIRDFEIPPGMVLVQIDQKTGKKVDEGTPGSFEGAFLAGREPKERLTAPGASGATVDTQSEFLKEDFE